MDSEETFFTSVYEHDALVVVGVDETVRYWYGFTAIIMCL